MLTTHCNPAILYCARAHTKYTVTDLQPKHNQQWYNTLMGNRLQMRLLLCLANVLLQSGSIVADFCTSSNTCRTCRECSGVSNQFCKYTLSLFYQCTPYCMYSTWEDILSLSVNTHSACTLLLLYVWCELLDRWECRYTVFCVCVCVCVHMNSCYNPI